jgi:gluconolactonase
VKRPLALAVILAACGGGDDGAAVDASGDGDESIDASMNDCGCTGDRPPPANPLAGIGQVTLVGNGYQFTEGPQWRESANEFVFSDIDGNTIYHWPGSGTPTVFRMPSGSSNGLAIDSQNVLLACEHGNRRVARGDSATPTTVVDRFEGSRLNSPNDVVVRYDGTIYFTDPPYGIQDAQRELSFMGVFRISSLTGSLTAERRGALSERPNGIAIAPSQERLYVGDSEANLVRAFDIGFDGVLANARVFIPSVAGPDGMAVDVDGNLYIAASAGVAVYAPDGTLWGTISVPMQPANVAFGGNDHRTLLITARTAVYQVRTPLVGMPRN